MDASPIQPVRLSISIDRAPLCLPTIFLSQSREPQAHDLSGIERPLVSISDTEYNLLEVHTGDYCLADVHCVNTLTTLGIADPLFNQIGSMPLTILTEVVSLYNDREENAPQALIGIGSDVLGRSKSAFCANWGIANQWNLEPHLVASAHHQLGWAVDKVEKKSSILKWAGSSDLMQPLSCGQRLRIYPNDSATASDAFEWYYVIDSSRIGKEDEIVDIFVRWRE